MQCSPVSDGGHSTSGCVWFPRFVVRMLKHAPVPVICRHLRSLILCERHSSGRAAMLKQAGPALKDTHLDPMHLADRVPRDTGYF